MSPSGSSSTSLFLLQLCSLLVIAVAMPTCRLQGNLLETAHNLLRDLGGLFPVHCLQNNTVIFPDSVFNPPGSTLPQCHQVSGVVYSTLRGTQQLFENQQLPGDEAGSPWNQQKLDEFQNILYRMVVDGSCLSRVEDSEVLKSFFSSLTAELQQQGSSVCGWEVVRRELLSVLDHVLQHHHSCLSWPRLPGPRPRP